MELYRDAAGMTPEEIDRLLRGPDCSSAVKRKRLVDEVFDKAARKYKRMDLPEVMEHADRRKKALLGIMNRAQQISGLSGIRSVPESLAVFETRSFLQYENLDAMYGVFLAASLWLLDELRRCGHMQEAFRMLPRSVEEIADFYLPLDFFHPCYETELIQSVGHVIISRRKEDTDTLTGLIGLLETDTVQRAFDRFTELQWTVIERFLRTEAYFDSRTRDALQQIKALAAPSVLALSPVHTEEQKVFFGGEAARSEEERRDLHMRFEQFIGEDKKKILGIRELGKILGGNAVNDPYETCFAFACLLRRDDDAAWLTKINTSVLFMAARLLPWYEFEEEWDEDDWEPSPLTYNGNGWLDREPAAEKTDYYHKMTGGRNLAQRIYQLSRGIVPVGLHPFETERKQMKEEGVGEADADAAADWAEFLFLSSFRAEAGNLYGNIRDWEYEDEEEDWEDGTGSAGGLTGETFEESGRSGEAFAEESGQAERVPAGGYWGAIAAAQGHLPRGRETVQAADAVGSGEAAEAELTRARKEIKNLRKLLSELQHDADARQVKYERELKTLRQEHRELADLRDLMFAREAQGPGNQGQGSRRPGRTDFPYETKKRTVIFGGHDSFLKVLRQMLPTAKYVDASNYGFNPEIVRNAEVVWIQTNCISHSQYGNIVKITRPRGIQLRYFTYASAEKCAEQVVKEDGKA